MNAKMSKGTPIKDHTIHMIKIFNEMKTLGAKIDGKTQVDMVLKTMLDSFKRFKLNYFMNKMVMSLTKLMRKLYMDERILKDQKGIHMAIKGSLAKEKPE